MAGKRGWGEGSIYQRASDGRWIGAVSLGRDERGKPIRKTVSGRTRAETVAAMRKVLRQVEDGLPVPDARTTVNELFDRWEADVLRHQVSENTFDNYHSVATHHIRPLLGTKRLVKLMPADVDAMISKKLDEGYAPSTVRRMRSVLAEALSQGERWGLVTRNVAAVTRAPRAPRVEGRTLTDDQAQSLLTFLKGNRLEALFVTMLGLGLRRGEALGLRWTDVDLERGVLTIRRSLRRGRSGLVAGEVKTASSHRSLNIPEPIAALLVEHRHRQRLERLASEFWEESGYVFTSEIGTALDPRNVYRSFVEITESAGIGRWHPHELRHSAASIMLAAGVPIEVVSNVLGHSSIRITADVYGHILEPQRQRAAEAMAQALWK